MSRQRIPHSDIPNHLACISWPEAVEKYPEIARITSKFSYKSIVLGRKMQMTDQACTMLRALNLYDQEHITKEMVDICCFPARHDASPNRRNRSQRLLRCSYPLKTITI